MSAPYSPYAGCVVALLTQHGKEKLVAPVLASGLGCRIEHVTGFDTDRLGTFTREIPRDGSQRDAARKKARIGMSLAGLPIGMASEGAFCQDPIAGMLPWNIEVLLWIDQRRELEVVGFAQGPACHAHQYCDDWAALEVFARKVGFPAQQLVLRPDHVDHPVVAKDMHDWAALAAAFDEMRAWSNTARVAVETDGRAHANPTRQAMIRTAAQDLVARLGRACPACGAPGFGQVAAVPGLPCINCETPTSQARADRLGCPACGYQTDQPRSGPTAADPAHCPRCNP